MDLRMKFYSERRQLKNHAVETCIPSSIESPSVEIGKICLDVFHCDLV